MKKLSLIIIMLIACFAMTSCNNEDSKSNQELIVGRWKSVSANYFEVYNANGTGKMWNEDDDVYEDEADTFTWQIENNDNTKFTQVINFHSGAAELPQMCNIEVLTESSFSYNNDGWRRTENLKRVN